jgi:hypothetical protein
VADDFKFKITNLNEVLRGLDKSEKRIEAAGAYAIAQVGLAVEREVKITLNNNPHVKTRSGWSPAGHIGGDGTPPNRRTGNLMSSVRTEVRSGFGTYTASVFPTMIYARRLEVGLNYPYLRPTAVRMKPRIKAIFQYNFLKKWR